MTRFLWSPHSEKFHKRTSKTYTLGVRRAVSRATASKFRCIMSAVGTTPLQSPGCNEGKARNETLGFARTKSNIELRRSGTITRTFILRLGSAAPLGLNRCVPIINPGLAPWAMQEYRPYRTPLRLSNQYTLLF